MRGARRTAPAGAQPGSALRRWARSGPRAWRRGAAHGVSRALRQGAGRHRPACGWRGRPPVGGCATRPCGRSHGAGALALCALAGAPRSGALALWRCALAPGARWRSGAWRSGAPLAPALWRSGAMARGALALWRLAPGALALWRSGAQLYRRAESARQSALPCIRLPPDLHKASRAKWAETLRAGLGSSCLRRLLRPVHPSNCAQTAGSRLPDGRRLLPGEGKRMRAQEPVNPAIWEVSDTRPEASMESPAAGVGAGRRRALSAWVGRWPPGPAAPGLDLPGYPLFLVKALDEPADVVRLVTGRRRGLRHRVALGQQRRHPALRRRQAEDHLTPAPGRCAGCSPGPPPAPAPLPGEPRNPPARRPPG